MIHHNLESGDDFSAGKSVTEGQILIQITSNGMKSQTRGVFTVKEAERFAEEIQKQVKLAKPDNVATYKCGKCEGTDVQLKFPLWVDANDIDNKEEWEIDTDAEPEKDTDKCWCNDCRDHRFLVRIASGK